MSEVEEKKEDDLALELGPNMLLNIKVGSIVL
jgi:hypothetical protein